MYMDMDTKIDKFMAEFCPFGYRDMQMAISMYEDAGKHYDDLAGDVQSFMDDTGTPIDKIDVCGVGMDALMQEARTYIEAHTGKDISNDAPYDGVNVAANYMCTMLDAKTEDFLALARLIETIPTDQQTDVVKWLYQEVNNV